MAKKKFQIEIHRTYKCYFTYKAHSKQEIEDMINWDTGPNVTDKMCTDFWDDLSYHESKQELQQMDIDNKNPCLIKISQ